MQQITTIAALRDFTPSTNYERFVRHLWTLETLLNDATLGPYRSTWVQDLCRELTYDLGSDVIYDDGSLYLVKKERIAQIPSGWTLKTFTTSKEKDS